MNRSRRMLHRSILVAGLLLPCSMASASPARPGLVATVAPAEQKALAAEIAAARAAHPEAFAAVAAVADFRRARYIKTRARRPEAARAFRAVARLHGRPAVLAMIEMLAFTGHPAGEGLSDKEVAALEIGLLDAVGHAREPAALPILRAAYDGLDGALTFAAAAALARLGPEGVAVLLAVGADRAPDSEIAVHRSQAAATALGDLLLARYDRLLDVDLAVRRAAAAEVARGSAAIVELCTGTAAERARAAPLAGRALAAALVAEDARRLARLVEGRGLARLATALRAGPHAARRATLPDARPDGL